MSAPIKWACPKCAANANEHGKGGNDKCKQLRRLRSESACDGFLCLCDDDTGDGHGESLSNPCPEAHCYHCEWTGTFPALPKGLEAWEKKAIAAGWTMPGERKKELKL